jgi:acyl-CoA reductase-like NAD-dependent aldehyde dehydrogenase
VTVQQRIQSWDPARPSDLVGDIEALDGESTDRLIVQARAVGPAWSLDGPGRVAALTAWASSIEGDAASLAILLSREVGKPIVEARAEVARGVSILRYYAQHALDEIAVAYPAALDSRLWVQRRPRGLVLAVTPWNFPVAIPMWKLAPALASGNTAFLRPSSAAIATAHRLVELAVDRLPEGVLALAPIGHDLTGSLIESRRIDAVSFTGSVEVGRSLAVVSARAGVPIQAELGGQNAAIVLADADFPAAATMIVGAAMAYAGQKCTATSRVIVTQPAAGPLIDALVAAVESLVVGDPRGESTVVGPVISGSSRAAFERAVTAAVETDGSILAVASRPKGDGHYVEPTLVKVGSDLVQLMQEEIFGPVAAVMVAADDDEAVSIANGTSFGLVAAVYGGDITRAERTAERLEVGMVRINAPTTGVDYHAPFGGDRDSSYGPREQGKDARDFYTSTRTVLSRPA